MHFLKKFLLLILLPLIMVPACKKQKIYLKQESLRRLPTLHKSKETFCQEQEAVTVCAKKLTREDCLDYFNCNVVGCGFQPIALTIKNNSADMILLRTTSIDLPLLSPKKVARGCQWNTPLLTSTTGCLACIFFWQALIPIAYAGYKMSEYNNEIPKRLKTGVIHSTQAIEIPPFETVNKVMFVESDYCPSYFLITLFNHDKKKQLVFSIKI